MKVKHLQTGFTLIELVIGLFLVSIILGMAGPAFHNWTNNQQVRSLADSLVSGLMLARAEAIKRGATVEFTVSSQKGAWTVNAFNSGTGTYSNLVRQQLPKSSASTTEISTSIATIQNYAVALAPNTGGSVVFTSLGRVQDPVNDIKRIDVVNTNNGTTRRVIKINPGGSVQLCNPSVPNTSPDSC